jgi:hypothetical protein
VAQQVGLKGASHVSQAGHIKHLEFWRENLSGGHADEAN